MGGLDWTSHASLSQYPKPPLGFMNLPKGLSLGG